MWANYYSKNFVVVEWTKFAPLIKIIGKWTWGEIETMVKYGFETLRDNLLVSNHFTTLINLFLTCNELSSSK